MIPAVSELYGGDYSFPEKRGCAFLSGSCLCFTAECVNKDLSAGSKAGKIKFEVVGSHASIEKPEFLELSDVIRCDFAMKQHEYTYKKFF